MSAYFVGVLAGLASVMLAVAATFGGALGVALMFFAPLPIAIASLGWGTTAALMSAIVSLAGIFMITGVEGAAVYAVFAALPVALAGYELGLARPTDEANGGGDLVWYPLGRVLAHIAMIIGFGMIALGVLSGQSVNEAVTLLTEIMMQAMEANDLTPGSDVAPTADDIRALARSYVEFMPFATPLAWCLVVVVNLWIGARIVRASGRLRRPWPDLASAEIELPYAMIFSVSAALAFMSGALGFAARPVAGAFFAAFFLVGLGILHTVLRGKPMRSFILALVYVGVLILSIPALVLATMGALEPVVRLKARAAANAAPPKPPQ